MTDRTISPITTPASLPVVAAPVLVGIVGTVSAEAGLRAGFEHAKLCRTTVHVVCAGHASAADDAFLNDLIDRWAEKFPDVPVRSRICRAVDAAVTLVAAARHCGAVVLPASSEPVVAAVTTAVARRAHCPVIVVGAVEPAV
jgi:hypothetical protein